MIGREFPCDRRMGGRTALDPSAALRLFDEAWTIPDHESRLVSLRTIWADDGLYVDPDVPDGTSQGRSFSTRTPRGDLFLRLVEAGQPGDSPVSGELDEVDPAE